MNYARVIDNIFKQFDGPRFAVKLWDGQTNHYGSGPKIDFTLIIADAETAKRLLAQGSLGFGESYMEGRLKIEGDLEAYLRLRRQFKRIRRSPRLAFAKFLASINIPRDRKNQIAHHYDLGNDFFEMILDRETMCYSAGSYKNGTESLVTAQHNKLELICRWLDLRPNASVLDLGSGWGGFAIHAVRNFNLHVTGYTLSQAQLEYCQKLIKLNSLEQQVHFEYRDMVTALPETQYDGVVMIESIEHVGQGRLPDFLRSVIQILKPGQPFLIQTTGRYLPRPFDRWTQKYVFPGGYLPGKDELLGAARGAGFLVDEFRDDTGDYVRTMSAWIQNLANHHPEIADKFGQPFYRLWELWMHGARVNFNIGSMSLFRLLLRRP